LCGHLHDGVVPVALVLRPLHAHLQQRLPQPPLLHEHVVLALQRRHAAVHHDLPLRRHLDEHVLLQAAEQEGADDLVELGDDLLLALRADDLVDLLWCVMEEGERERESGG